MLGKMHAFVGIKVAEATNFARRTTKVKVATTAEEALVEDMLRDAEVAATKAIRGLAVSPAIVEAIGALSIITTRLVFDQMPSHQNGITRKHPTKRVDSHTVLGSDQPIYQPSIDRW
jgi:hypothetical protein